MSVVPDVNFGEREDEDRNKGGHREDANDVAFEEVAHGSALGLGGLGGGQRVDCRAAPLIACAAHGNDRQRLAVLAMVIVESGLATIDADQGLRAGKLATLNGARHCGMRPADHRITITRGGARVAEGSVAAAVVRLRAHDAGDEWAHGSALRCGRLPLKRPNRCRPEQILALQLHIGRDAPASLPVENTLSSGGLVEPQLSSELARAAEPVDECGVVHTTLNTTFTQLVNTPCINKVFSAVKISGMDSSYIRLMEAAKEATAGRAQPVRTQSDLARDMNESPQSIHNWKLRGVSKEGALKAEGLYGVSANHILEGVDVSRPPGPPPPPRDFSDRREVSETDWGLLQDVQLVMSDYELEQLRVRAERMRRIAQKQLESVAAGAPGSRPSERTISDQNSRGQAKRHAK